MNLLASLPPWIAVAAPLLIVGVALLFRYRERGPAETSTPSAPTTPASDSPSTED